MKTDTLPFVPLDPDGLTVYANPGDLRRDLHLFVRYVKEHDIKRTVRDNDIPLSHHKRLTQAMSVSESNPAKQRRTYYDTKPYTWVHFIDDLAFRMGFIHYLRGGEYHDNYMNIKADPYREFLLLTMPEQERRLLDSLIEDYSAHRNEFYADSMLGRLNHFPDRNAGTGMTQSLNYATVRGFLLGLLEECEPGIWYSTASLIAYLKRYHPFFLLPETAPEPPPNRYAATLPRGYRERYPNLYQPKPIGRYDNFYESNSQQTPIPDDAPDAFERVEGRYLERFLEDIPLTLGYVEVAYDSARSSSPRLSQGTLTAFRVTERFLHAMRGDLPDPRMIVQPNFEIYIESGYYPAHLLSRLAPLTDIIREDTTTILKLNKQKVATQLAENDGLDIVALLTNFSGRPLPQNVMIELQEWSSYADAFTLYEGFGLIECTDDLPEADTFTTQQIGNSQRLVREPGILLKQLREADIIVLSIHHPDDALLLLPAKANTVLPREAPPMPIPKKSRQPVTLTREALIALYFPDEMLLNTFCNALRDAGCAFETVQEQRKLIIATRDQAYIKQVIKQLSADYKFRLEDLS